MNYKLISYLANKVEGVSQLLFSKKENLSGPRRYKSFFLCNIKFNWHWKKKKVHWASGNSLEPSSYDDLLPGVTDVVHSVGILMETNNNGSPVTFEMMNRDTGIKTQQ